MIIFVILFRFEKKKKNQNKLKLKSSYSLITNAKCLITMPRKQEIFTDLMRENPTGRNHQNEMAI